MTGDALVKTDAEPIDDLAAEVQRRAPRDAALLLASVPERVAADVLQSLNPAVAQDILDELPAERRGAILNAASPQQRAQWLRNDRYPEETIGRLMEPPAAVFRREQTIAGTIDAVRELTKTSFVTYGFVVDDDGRLCGVITMRDLLLSARDSASRT